MARAPMPAPQPLESPAVRRSAMLAQMLEQQRQPVEIRGGYGELAARLLGQGITQFSANRAEKAVKDERAQQLARQIEGGRLALERVGGGGGGGAAPAPASVSPPLPMAPPVTNTQEPVQAQTAPAAAVMGSPLPPTGQPIPVADVPPAPQPAAPMPQAAPAPPQNPLGITPGERELITRALSSGDPGQIAWAQGVIGEIENRMAAPSAERQEIQMVNGVPHYIDPTGAAPPRPVFADGIPEIARTRDEFNPQGTRAGTLGQRDPTGRLSIIDEPPEGFQAVGDRLQPIGGGPRDPSAGENAITNERDLRREFETATAEYRNVRQAFQKVETSLAQGTGIGDVGGIFGVMKVFDPGSTVREGEAATVQNSGGVPERFRGLYNQTLNGQRLTPQQRAEIVAVARAQFGTYEEGYQSRVSDFVGMAQQYGLNPSNVVGERQSPRPRPAPSRPRATPAAPSGPRRSNGQTRRYNPNTGQLE